MPPDGRGASPAGPSLLLEGGVRIGSTGPGDAALLLAGGLIRAEGLAATEAASARRARRVNLDGLILAPGFIELQVNGAAGHDLTYDPESIWAVGAALAAAGVTTFLPTIVTSPPEVVAMAQRVVTAGPPAGYAGATALGLHLEGPFLSPLRHGAHEAALLRPPDVAAVRQWAPPSGVRLVTLAPELPGALEVARSLVSRGVVVSAGHSNATAAEAAAGFDAGIRYVTHLFNAMRPFDRREPGLAGAALTDSRVTIGVIPDGVHLAPTALNLAWRLAAPDRFSIVTDAVAAVATPSGEQSLGGQDVVLDGSAARLRDGTLAGSLIGMDQAIRNVAAFTGAPADAVIRAVTTTPARLLGLDDRATLAPGSRADLVVLTPELEVVATIVAGRVVFATDDRWG